MAPKEITSLILEAESKRVFFLIHGYTGSSDDFHNLPGILHKKFNANVKVMLLPGHGTKVEDLDHITYADFMYVLRNELEKELSKGMEVILGGVSMGGLFALLLAAEYPVQGVFNVSSPYVMKFPFNLPGLKYILKYKKYWKKATQSSTHSKTSGSFSYTHMHSNGFYIAVQAKKELRRTLKNVSSPLLTIFSTKDDIGHIRSVRSIQEGANSSIKREGIFHIEPHNVFYSNEDHKVNDEIVRFIEYIDLPEKHLGSREKIAAIIPAYNEGSRIEAVLHAVTAVSLIDEMIVVDDGSTDNTREVVTKFPNVTYIQNEVNIGKAGSLDKGVTHTDASILFFCDADLRGITPTMIEQILEPVLFRTYTMFIGLRANPMQKSVHLFAINSGERALTREVWEKLPHYFKHRYRVEAGLNYMVRKYFGGFGYRTFDYSQPLKETKYGLMRGTYLRWSMNMDVLLAYAREIIERLFRP